MRMVSVEAVPDLRTWLAASQDLQVYELLCRDPPTGAAEVLPTIANPHSTPRSVDVAPSALLSARFMSTDSLVNDGCVLGAV